MIWRLNLTERKKEVPKIYNLFFKVEKDVDPNKEHGWHIVGRNQAGFTKHGSF